MTKVVLHIGVHKTGTSFIQGCLAKNRAWLCERGISYCPGDKNAPRHHPTNHHPLVQKFDQSGTRTAEGIRDIEDLLADANHTGCHTLLLSSEMLSSGNADIEPIISTFKAAGREVSVIAYIRRPDDIIASAYNQTVRSFVRRRTEPFSMRNKGYDPTYQRVLRRWMRPDVKLTLAPYDPKQWIGGKLMADCLSMLSVSDFSGFDMAGMEGEENISLPMPLLEIVRRFNELTTSNKDHKKFVADLYEIYRQRPDAFRPFDLLTVEQRMEMCSDLAKVMHLYRPYFRPGFDERFLTDCALDA